MSPVALALVLVAAFLHAVWNLLAKRAGGGAAFTWLFGVWSALIYAPAGLYLVVRDEIALGPLEVGFVLGSAVIHVAYFLTLQRGYRAGAMSVVYPLARGTGPMLALVGAVLLFGERPSAAALAGAAVIIGSVFLIAGGPAALARAARSGGAAGYGLVTGVFIAMYTLWDAYAVATLLVVPLVYMWLSEVARVALLTPTALRRWEDVRHHWREHRLETLGVAVLSPLSYILVLSAFVFTPVSLVAPVREVSILIGAALGSRLLAEGGGWVRVLAVTGMFAGVVAIARG